MTFIRYFTPCDWEFGFGFTLPSRGTAIEGLVTVRPWRVFVYVGPWTFEVEGAGRCDIEIDT